MEKFPQSARSTSAPVCGILVLLMLCHSAVAAQMVPVSAGSFTMGGNEGESDERPEHPVAVSPFFIDKKEITIATYDSCVRAGRCSPAHYDDGTCYRWAGSGFKKVSIAPSLRRPELPVTCVTWEQARSCCSYRGGRLATEAQWEYAAGGGNRTYAWGAAAPTADRCAFSRANGPQPVCSYTANAAGLCDMTGNAWEWVHDYYAPDFYAQSPPSDPAGPDVGRYRVIRGGGWYSSAGQLRVHNRHWFSPEFAEVSIGFRCVR